MSQPSEIPLRIARKRKDAEEWALVLAAEGLSPRVQRVPEGFALCVPREQAQQADAALAAYETENRQEWNQVEATELAHLGASLWISGALLAFFLVTGPRSPAVHWFERGSADAGRILLGELWRAVTALTLHADLLHILANGIAATLFFTALFQLLGPGLGSALVLLAGTAGNLLNACMHGSAHLSVGASTSVFGAVGLLGVLGVARRRRGGTRGRRAWAPLVAGLALLAMLGSGERADLGAHGFGFLVGAVLGFPVGRWVPRPPGRKTQRIAAGLALAVVLGCWSLALR